MLEEPKQCLTLRNLREHITPKLKETYISKDSVVSSADFDDILEEAFRPNSQITIPSGSMIGGEQVVQALQRTYEEISRARMQAIYANVPFVVETGVITSLPKTIIDNRVTSEHFVLNDVTPYANNINWETTDYGQIILTGTLNSGETIPNMKLIVQRVDVVPNPEAYRYDPFMVETGTISSLPMTITDSRITSRHYVLNELTIHINNISWETNDNHQLILTGYLGTGETLPSIKLIMQEIKSEGSGE